MFKNYLLIAVRNFKRQKLFSFLNIFGLALGLASAILIFLYVSDELTYDVMHPAYKNTYRVGATFKNPDGQTFDNTVSPGFFLLNISTTTAVRCSIPPGSLTSDTPRRYMTNRKTRSYLQKKSVGLNLASRKFLTFIWYRATNKKCSKTPTRW